MIYTIIIYILITNAATKYLILLILEIFHCLPFLTWNAWDYWLCNLFILSSEQAICIYFQRKAPPKWLTMTVHWKSRCHPAPARWTADSICEPGWQAPALKGHPSVVRSTQATTASTTDRSSLFCHQAGVAFLPYLSLLSSPCHPSSC